MKDLDGGVSPTNVVSHSQPQITSPHPILPCLYFHVCLLYNVLNTSSGSGKTLCRPSPQETPSSNFVVHLRWCLTQLQQLGEEIKAMEWYCGNRVNDVVVPRDQGAWSRFPSQEKWKQCGVDALESFESHDKSFAMWNSFTDEADFTCETLMDEIEMDCMVVDGEQEEISGVRGGISESSTCWTTLLNNQDYRLDGFPGTNQTDENFVNSLLVDDVRVSEQFHSYGSPVAHSTYSTANDLTSDELLNLDVLGSYEHMNAQDFPYSLGWEKKQSDTPHHNLSNMMNTVVPQCNTPTGDVEAPPRQLCASRRVGDQPSVEETVLQELGSAMQQMTDKSRLCFRDAFYRLASNAGKHLGIQGQHGDKLASEKPFTTAFLDQTLRCMEKDASESRTNAIDRTVADLMFCKPYEYDAEWRQGLIKPGSGSGYLPKLPLACHNTGPVPGDAEVPTFSRGATTQSTKEIQYRFVV